MIITVLNDLNEAELVLVEFQGEILGDESNPKDLAGLHLGDFAIDGVSCWTLMSWGKGSSCCSA